MADHLRKRIRDVVFVELFDIPGLTAARSRIHAWQDDELPGASVYATEEISRTRPVDDRTQERTLRLVIDLRVSAKENLDDAVDYWANEIEKVMAANWQIDGLAIRSQLANTSITMTGEAEKRQGAAMLEYDVVYQTLPGAPDQPL